MTKLLNILKHHECFNSIDLYSKIYLILSLCRLSKIYIKDFSKYYLDF